MVRTRPTQPAGAGPTVPPQSWGDNRNRFHSINAQIHARLRPGRAQRADSPVRDVSEHRSPPTRRPRRAGVSRTGVDHRTGAQHSTGDRAAKVARPRGLSRCTLQAAAGLSHGSEDRCQPSRYDARLGFPSSSGAAGILFLHAHAPMIDGGRSRVSVGNTRTDADRLSGAVETPLTQVGVYLQDDWRVTDRLTVNAGVRYDVTIGYQIDQSKNPEFRRAAGGGPGRPVHRTSIGMEDFGNNAAQRLRQYSATSGIRLERARRRQRKSFAAAGVIYTDTAYTNSNILFPAGDALGIVTTGQFLATDTNGLRNPDGSFFRVGDPISNIASPQRGRTDWISWRSRLPAAPATVQSDRHRSGGRTSSARLIAFSADVIHADGRDLNLRRAAELAPERWSASFRRSGPGSELGKFQSGDQSRCSSVYDALLVSLRRRSATGIDFALSYTLSRAKSDLGQGVDETGLGPNTIQDATDPFARGAVRTRHRATPGISSR